ncbi:MAG: hypothetical protein ABIR32_17945 [Ilumatobacteraceae bacterium]
MTSLDRRTFLIASGALALAACGSDSAATADSTPGEFDLAVRFPRELQVPGELRLVYSIASNQALLSDGPDTLTGRILNNADNSTVVESITATKRRVTEALCYWDFHPTITDTGIYTLYVEGAVADGTAIGVYDPATLSVPSRGTVLPPVDTPTTDNPRGVDPICTRVEGGPCPFHSMTLTEALATGKPVAYMIGTPAHCQFGTCGPGMEFLINASKRIGDGLVVVHAEVYTDDTATVAAPAMEAYSLAFEPMIFLADASGVITQRIEGVWDQSELDEELAKLMV